MILKRSSNKILLVLGHRLCLWDMTDATLVGVFFKCHTFYLESGLGFLVNMKW